MTAIKTARIEAKVAAFEQSQNAARLAFEEKLADKRSAAFEKALAGFTAKWNATQNRKDKSALTKFDAAAAKKAKAAKATQVFVSLSKTPHT